MELTNKRPEKKLIKILPKQSGRDNRGRVSVRHQGGRRKRYLRAIDFKRDKYNVKGIVESIEFDPNRSAYLALIVYDDGERRYILSPEGLKIQDKIVSGESVEIKIGNSLPLKNIPVGQAIHSVELQKGRGGQIIRSAGSSAQIVSKEKDYVLLKLPSGEVRKVHSLCLATIGQVGNVDWKSKVYGTAGRKRRLGIRPTVRGVAQNPGSHPHGGGEGRSGIGMKSPKSPWGKRTLGKRTRKKTKYSDKYIVKRKK